MRALYLFLALITIFSIGSAQAGCKPNKNTTPKTVCNTQPCDTIGESVLDADEQNIIVCLKDSTGAKKWKATTSGGGSGTVVYGSLCTFTSWDYEQNGCISTCPSGYTAIAGNCGINNISSGHAIVYSKQHTVHSPGDSWKCVTQHPGGYNVNAPSSVQAICIK